VISRAGALSISELCLVGKAAILVPSPNVAEDHQTKNAMALVEANAAIKINDNTARQELVDAALALLKDDSRQAMFANNIAKLAKPDAAKNIAEIVVSVIGESKKNS
jgi:UDP-N-acetylglucosamine--N-acetylmuramyl-(pentapeptide) pyrophosphoryl-undecaprenol N-acetylglucosamine transferase